MNKASEGNGIPAEQFKLLKDDSVEVRHLIYHQIWKIQQWPQDWKRSVYIPIPKKGNSRECSNYHTIALILHASKVITDSVDMSLSELQELVWTGRPSVLRFMGSQRVGHD